MSDSDAVGIAVKQRLETYLNNRKETLPPHTRLFAQMLIHAIREWTALRDVPTCPKRRSCEKTVHAYQQVREWFWSDSEFIGTVTVEVCRRGRKKRHKVGFISFGAICLALDLNPDTVRRLLEARSYSAIEEVYYDHFGTRHRKRAADSTSWWDPDSAR